MMQRMRGDVVDLGKPELGPRMEGRQMIMILAPLK